MSDSNPPPYGSTDPERYVPFVLRWITGTYLPERARLESQLRIAVNALQTHHDLAEQVLSILIAATRPPEVRPGDVRSVTAEAAIVAVGTVTATATVHRPFPRMPPPPAPAPSTTPDVQAAGWRLAWLTIAMIPIVVIWVELHPECGVTPNEAAQTLGELAGLFFLADRLRRPRR